jgi:signal transduction histidine kinase
MTARGRTAREWTHDAGLFAVAAVAWWLVWRSYPAHYADAVPGWSHLIDPWVGAAGCVALWWRRRFPLALAITMVAVLSVAGTGLGAALVAVFTVAVHRGWIPATAVTGLHLLPALLFGYENPPPGLSPWAYVAFIALMYLVPLGWGMAVRARRQVVANLRRDVEREREEHRRRLAGARRTERERIAREMHDVLAHRISLISVHAGALTYRTAQADGGVGRPLDPTEVGRAIGVIGDTARQALVELGDVLAMLRADDSEEPAGPGTGLADIPRLVRDARAAGQAVTLALECEPEAEASVRPAAQRTAYRAVQEGLTNARKHAPTMPVRLRVAASPSTGVVVEVTNPLSPNGSGDIPGAGLGLTGLAERVTLHGGSIDHGPMDRSFRLTVRLPWST